MIEKAFIKLFTGQITYKDQAVPVLIRYKPIDRTPCITLRKATEIQKGRSVQFNPLENVQYHVSNTVWIDVWANKEEQRQEITSQVKKVLYDAINNHFRVCENFENGMCKTTQDICEIAHRQDAHKYKNQCLTPKKNKYMSFFKQNKILKWSFKKIGELRLDEVDFNPPLLRTQVQVGFNRIKNVKVGGHVFTDISIESQK